MYQNMPSELKEVHLACPTTKKETQSSRFLRQHFLFLGIFLDISISWVKGKVSKFVWDTEKQRALLQIQDAFQVTLQLGSYNLISDVPLPKTESITIIQGKLSSSWTKMVEVKVARGTEYSYILKVELTGFAD